MAEKPVDLRRVLKEGPKDKKEEAIVLAYKLGWIYGPDSFHLSRDGREAQARR